MEIFKIFQIDKDTDIFQLFRVRLGDGEPYILEYTFIPYSLIPNIEQYDFTIYSLYDIYNKHEIILAHDIQTLEIVTALLHSLLY